MILCQLFWQILHGACSLLTYTEGDWKILHQRYPPTTKCLVLAVPRGKLWATRPPDHLTTWVLAAVLGRLVQESMQACKTYETKCKFQAYVFYDMTNQCGRPEGTHSHLLRKIMLYWGQWHFHFHQQISTLDAWVSLVEVQHKDFQQLHKSLEFHQEQLSTLTEGNKSLWPQKLFLVYNHAAWEPVLFFLASQSTHRMIQCLPHIHVFVVLPQCQLQPIVAAPGTL